MFIITFYLAAGEYVDMSSMWSFGCGRYSSKHAEQHYKDSQHVFSMELATGRIWHYEEDAFVHVDSKLQYDRDELLSIEDSQVRITGFEMPFNESAKKMSLFGVLLGSSSMISRSLMKKFDQNLSSVVFNPNWMLLDFSTREKITNLT